MLSIITGTVHATTLRGIVLANELGGPPMGRVSVGSDGANETITDDQGKFVLGFPRFQAGDRVRLVVNPRTYLPYVAETLTYLGIVAYAQNRMEAARKAGEESLEIYRVLAKADPYRYQPDVHKMEQLMENFNEKSGSAR
jgi:hypothetical protein